MRKFFFLPLVISVLQLVAGCTKQHNSGYSSMPVNDTVYKSYLALGDSYTIGQSVAAADRFPAQAISMLANDSLRFLAPEYIAITGWTTRNLLNSINSMPPTRSKYDFVSLLIGVNNQYQGRSQAEYRTEFTELLNTAIRYAGNRPSRVAVLSIPDWGATPFAYGQDTGLISMQIDAFNAINKQITLASGVQYIDITPSSRMALTDPSLVASDGLHPSGKEYKKWATLLAAFMKTVL
jgi:lysophospholipase L1-like esterase